MALDALRNLTKYIPSWQERLDVLSGQIDKRQLELAALALASLEKEPGIRRLRNKGSTESLKPKDDGPMHSSPEEQLGQPTSTASTPFQADGQERPTPPSMAVAPRAPVKSSLDVGVPLDHKPSRKRNRSISSVDESRVSYRTKSMIIVYYDSYVQSFFDDLVRFISSSRNLMRKAKMAAKVAQIKRLAEMEVSDEENTSGDDKASQEALPSLRYINSRQYGTAALRFGPPSLMNQSPDVYDELDKALEFVQSTCEHGAHQFLRDAKCNEEIRNIQKHMAEVLKLATEELERVQREEPELAKESADSTKARMKRPITISRALVPHHKETDDAYSRKLEVADPGAPRPPILHVVDAIEADPNVANDDFDVEAMMQQIRYRSTRHMYATAN